MEEWVNKNIKHVEIRISKDSLDELVDTGNSFCKATKALKDEIPTIVTFCDYIYRDNDLSFQEDGI
jgi:hypothetical protein